MVKELKSTHIAYRCPECGDIIYGLVGQFALSAGMVRIKCSCGHSALDITVTNDKKLRLSVPCMFCRQNHSFVVSQSIFYGRDLFLLNCPYANMDICFMGDKEKTDLAIDEATEKLNQLLKNLELESIRDMQPVDLDEEDILPDAEMYDALKFLSAELMADGKLDCPCHSGEYDLRYCKAGIELYCTKCGASYTFTAVSGARSEEFLEIDELYLK